MPRDVELYIGEKQNFKHNAFVKPKPVNGSRSTGLMWSYFLPFMISRAACTVLDYLKFLDKVIPRIVMTTLDKCMHKNNFQVF